MLHTAPILLFIAPVCARQRQVNNTLVGWVPEPDGRGTLGILLLCIVTLGLCVWTALHLNVEPASFRHNLQIPPNAIGKILWAFVALIAPELVSTVALHQFLVARRYRDFVNRGESRDQQISLSKAFFAIMGGIARVEPDRYRKDSLIRPLDVSPLRQWRMQRDAERMYSRYPGGGDLLIPVSIDALVTDEWKRYIQRISDIEVDVRSKADGLTKFLVCSQAAWALLQCLARNIDGLPLTPIEITTALHIGNLMIMYGVWWKKPVDAGRSIMLFSKEDMESVLRVQAFRNVYSSAERQYKLLYDNYQGIQATRDANMISENEPSPSLYDFDMMMREFSPPDGRDSAVVDLTAVVVDPWDDKNIRYQNRRLYMSELIDGNKLVLALRGIVDQIKLVTHSGGKEDLAEHKRALITIVSLIQQLDTLHRDVMLYEGPDEDGEGSQLLEWNEMLRAEVFNFGGPMNPLWKVEEKITEMYVYFCNNLCMSWWSSRMIPNIALLVQESDDLRFCNVHIDALRSAHKQIDRFIISLLPKEETTWWQRQKTTFWASVSITLDSMSKSLIWNQFIHIPGLFSYDPFHETGDLNSTASYRPIGGRLESFTPAVGAQIAPHERIWTVFGSSWQYRHRLILVTFSGVAGCVYGSVHAVKWNQQFPTMAERRMWQISCCMGLLGVLPVIAFGLTGFSPMWIKTEERRRWFNALCIICGLVMTVCFIFARSFLVVESLLALRNMPASAYATVKWLDFWKSGLSVGQQ